MIKRLIFPSSIISRLYEKSEILTQSSVISKNEEAVNSSLMSKVRSLSLSFTASLAILESCSSVSSLTVLEISRRDRQQLEAAEVDPYLLAYSVVLNKDPDDLNCIHHSTR